MKDKLSLEDLSIPLRKRYDDFLVWSNSNASSIIEIIAEQLGVQPGVVDVFNELANLEDDEFEIIDKNKIDIDSLFLIVRNNKSIRSKIYENSTQLLKSDQPLTAIRSFIERAVEPNYHELVQKISPNSLKSIAKYLKDRSIVSGTITAQLPSMLSKAAVKRSKEELISEKMVDWIIRAMTRDLEKELNIFCNDNIKNNFPEDYKIFIELRNYITSSTQE